MFGRGMPATSTGVHNRIREATLFGEASFEPVRGLIATVGGRLTNSRLTGEVLDPIALLSLAAIAKAAAQANRSETLRSEERRAGKECVRSCRTRGSP